MVQLLHNQRTTATGETLLQRLGWQVASSVSAHLSRIDRDKAKHHQLKPAVEFNAKQKALRFEKKQRAATVSELIARAAAQKQKTREKQRHYYHAKKRLLYDAEEMKKGGGAAVVEEKVVGVPTAQVVGRKRGRPRGGAAGHRDWRQRECKCKDSQEEEGVEADVAIVSAGAASGVRRPVLKALVMNRVVGVSSVSQRVGFNPG